MLEAPRGGMRRPLAEVAAALGGAGFSPLGRSGGGDDALATAGPDWVGAEQGHMKVAVMLVSQEHVSRGGSAPHLLAEHVVRAELLTAAGWRVVHAWMPQWGTLQDAQERVQHITHAL
eukprot:CAMPEP_0202877682 /NCGR_PEP_ID=MMETSP1391-20130828/31025_1 /ASSEMBLY_ACC=CAM_ASM_000867 /TAXON_ID=1034604 /ORGANISM="Chlamydomonas leiostraca, Strain SAG 11-49" /LENGTH=117 /DNA_ID=CAMNT_0049559761 /DNA_START=21 /DNA_END=371 /DNA_ORIENTATION=+